MATYNVYVFNLTGVNSTGYEDADVEKAIESAVDSYNGTLVDMVYSSLDGTNIAILSETNVNTPKELSDSHIRDCKILLDSLDNMEAIEYETTYGDDILVVAVSENNNVESWKIMSQGTHKTTVFNFIGYDGAENQYGVTIEEESE